MIETKVLSKLNQLVETEMSSLKGNLFLKTANGYQLFEKYNVDLSGGEYSVTYNSVLVASFSSLKTAVSWCIADHYKQRSLAESIISLEQKRRVVANDVAVRKAILKKFKHSSRQETVELKLQTRRYKLQSLDEQLNKCVNMAKYWQLRGFNNEIARTRRTPSNKKYS